MENADLLLAAYDGQPEGDADGQPEGDADDRPVRQADGNPGVLH